MKKIAIAVLKYGISLGILAYLFYSASQGEAFQELYHKPKHWPLLSLAFLLSLAGVSSTLVRWYLLVRALEMPFSLRDAFRLGFIGYLFNFLSLGVVGGDLLKAVFLARQQPGRRAEAVATVFVDRMIGLYALFVVGTIAFLVLGLDALEVRDPEKLAFVNSVCYAAMTLSAAGGVGLIVMLIPGFTTAPLWDALVGIPKLGPLFGQLIGAVRMYRRRAPLLLLTLLMSLGTHVLFTLSIYLTACGLPGAHPSLATHLVIVPIAQLAVTLPLPGGMGAFELALNFLYQGVASAAVAPQQGFIVAIAYRVITLLIAVVGVVYYFADRREVTELMHEAEKSQAAEASGGRDVSGGRRAESGEPEVNVERPTLNVELPTAK